MFLLFSFILVALIYIKDEKIELYEQITIEQGDTLWSLAEQYSGKMTKHDWVHAVIRDNALHSEDVISGQVLAVPVEKNSAYIAERNEPSHVQSIKVAREDNESK